jgi:YebC/PmpR family DNA-binding regulatory protein
MSGHSKWSTIKRQKGTTDAKRSQAFTKIANLITIAARLGSSGDLNSNPKLRTALETARKVNMPKENVQRAIDRGLGKLPGQMLEEVTYEGFGPSKVAFLVEGVTDNKLRTLAEVKNIFDRAGGSLGSQGSVSYMFDKKGEIKVKSKGLGEEEILGLIDLGVEDVDEIEEEGVNKYLIYIQSTELGNVSTSLTQLGYEIEESEVTMKPSITSEVGEEEIEKVFALVEKLEDMDDVQKVYINAG